MGTDRSEGRRYDCHLDEQHKRNVVLCIDDSELYNTDYTHIRALLSCLEESPQVVICQELQLHRRRLFQPRDHDRECRSTVIAAYMKLTRTYQIGDVIYLFGFSRGAYIVRFLAGMIGQVGLLRDESDYRTEWAYDLYIRSLEKEGDGLIPCQRFKASFSRSNVKIHFVGVWDTVFPKEGSRTLPERSSGMGSGMDHICVFRHALALDESRSRFAPVYGNRGGLPGAGDVKEVWFAGCHEEIGGVFHAEDSSDDSSRDLVGAAFRWMVYEAAEHGIELRLPQPGPLRPIRSTGETYSKRRALGSHQLVHESVFDAIDKIHYTPIAKPYRNWNDLLFRSAVQEYEPYLAGDKDPSVLKAEDLEGLVSTSIGLRSFLLRPDALDIVFHVLGDTDLNHPRQDLKALAVALKSLPTQREELRTHTYSEIRELATKLGLPPGEQNQILGKVGQGPFFAKRDVATLVAYSQRGSHIASVYNQGTVRLWFANTGNKDAGPHQLGPPSTSILSMAFALIDDGNAEAIVAGSSNGAVLALNISNGKSTEVGWHGRAVHSIACLPSGGIVSGSEDGTIRVWGHSEWCGHQAIVTCLSTSSDGLVIISGSSDKNVRRWRVDQISIRDAGCYQHREAIRAVACSNDALFIASGSADMACIWNVKANECHSLPHMADATSLAFTPKGDRLVVASGRDISIWDSANCRRLSTIPAHAAIIHSIALSPNGDHIVSASADRTIRVWDRHTGEQKVGPIKE
ncbi:hypothetical protein AB1N83_010837 [Pleurotus pulmonarius]